VEIGVKIPAAKKLSWGCGRFDTDTVGLMPTNPTTSCVMRELGNPPDCKSDLFGVA